MARTPEEREGRRPGLGPGAAASAQPMARRQSVGRARGSRWSCALGPDTRTGKRSGPTHQQAQRVGGGTVRAGTRLRGTQGTDYQCKTLIDVVDVVVISKCTEQSHGTASRS